MQSQGSLSNTNLASLLKTIQSERGTGTLSLEDGRHCSLYFLFGHLFHATGSDLHGEEVVVDALTWDHGTYRFDPRAKLPAEENIKSTPADLIATAERRQREQMAAAALPESAPASEPWATREPWGAREPAIEAPHYEEAAVEPIAEPVMPEPEPVMAPMWETEEVAAAAEPEYAEPEYVEEREPVLAAAGGHSAAAAAQVDIAATAAARTSGEGAADPGSSGRRTPSVTLDGEGGGESELTPVAEAAPLERLYPLPAGKKQYEGLKSAFVDFTKFLRTVRSDRHTGYVRLEGPGYSGNLLLHQGDTLEVLWSNERILRGEAAFQEFRRHMDDGTGLLDVIELSPESVVALAQLFTAQPLFVGLLGRFVDFNALLEYLAEVKIDGSVVILGEQETGVILLRGGSVIGAYTDSARELYSKTALVAALAKEPSARIEVKNGSLEVAPMDFEASLNRSY